MARRVSEMQGSQGSRGLCTAPLGEKILGNLRCVCVETCNPGHPLLPLQMRLEKNLQVEESSPQSFSKIHLVSKVKIKSQVSIYFDFPLFDPRTV